MKRHNALMFSTLFVCVLLVCGCSTTKFTAYHGSEVFQGKGGTESSVDGIDFWENGDPDRKYEILGIIEETPKHQIRLPLGHISGLFSDSGDRESTIANAARKEGGDAVVRVPKAPQPSTDADEAADAWPGNRSHQRFAFVVIKYME